jgi:hypothetical protein
MSAHHLTSEDPLGAIADEFVEAFRQGKRPSVEEFARRYPEHAAEIADVLPALVAMERPRPSPWPPTSRQRGRPLPCANSAITRSCAKWDAAAWASSMRLPRSR